MIPIDDPEAAADTLIAAFANRSFLPTRPPGQLPESDVETQPCVVMQTGSLTYADLPLTPSPSALIERFAAQSISSQFANFSAFDSARLRITEAPWLGGRLAFLPHRENGIDVPFFVTDENIILAGRTNEWIYDAMSRRPPPQCDDNLLDFVRFFFTTVVGTLDAFRFADRVDDAIWLPDASEDVKQEFTEKLQPLRIIGTSEDGRQELRGTVIFKNALFITSVKVARNWQLELTDEECLMEELPLAFGPQVDLLVRR
jgi:hypothetical protein